MNGLEEGLEYIFHAGRDLMEVMSSGEHDRYLPKVRLFSIGIMKKYQPATLQIILFGRNQLTGVSLDKVYKSSRRQIVK